MKNTSYDHSVMPPSFPSERHLINVNHSSTGRQRCVGLNTPLSISITSLCRFTVMYFYCAGNANLHLPPHTPSLSWTNFVLSLPPPSLSVATLPLQQSLYLRSFSLFLIFFSSPSICRWVHPFLMLLASSAQSRSFFIHLFLSSLFFFCPRLTFSSSVAILMFSVATAVFRAFGY